MEAVENLEIIREKLKKGEDVWLGKTTFVKLIQESKKVNAWNKCGLEIIFENDRRLYVIFNALNNKSYESLVQVIQVKMPKVLNTGALFEGDVTVV